MADLERYADLRRLREFSFPAYASAELIDAAISIAARFERSYRCYSRILDIAPQVGLVVLNEADWPRYAAFPSYGLTHYDYPHRMVVTATAPGTLLQPVVDFIQKHAPALVPDLQAVYGRRDGHIDLAAHVELWVAHDLGHAFQFDMSYQFPRLWLMEYFADLCSYTYVALEEPDRLPALETFPRVLRAVDARHVRYHTLAAFEAQYFGGDWSTANYSWYHGYLHETAKQAYQAAGVQSLQRMWQAFVLANLREVADGELAAILRQAQPELAQTLRAWPV